MTDRLDADEGPVVNRRWLDEHRWELKLSLLGPSGLYVPMTTFGSLDMQP